MTFTLDTSRWSSQAKALIRHTGRDAIDLLRSEGRLFLLDCARLTPPTSKSPFGESLNVQRRAGEKAVANDIQKLFVDCQSLDMVKKNPKLAAELQNYASRGQLEKARVLLARIGVKKPVILEADAATHRANRGYGGRVLRGRAKVVLRGASIRRLIKQKQKLVGLEKAGWLEAASALGVKLPAWITRHGSQPGLFRQDLFAENPSITIGNLVEYAQDHGRRLQIIQRALNHRADSLHKRLEHLLTKNFREH